MTSGVASVVDDRVRRCLARRLDAARRTLQGTLDDDAVRRGRQSIRRARSALRLLRPALRSRDYRRCDDALRDAARALSASRDAKVATAGFERMVRRAGLGAGDAAELRRAFDSSAPHAAEMPTSAAALTALVAAEHALECARVRGHDTKYVRDGLRRIYRRARRRYHAALSQPTPGALHEWRKAVKTLWQALDVVKPVRPRYVAERIREFHGLSRVLGAENDEALLESRVLATPASPARDELLEELRSSRRRLEQQAFSEGVRMFALKSRAFTRGIWPRRSGHVVSATRHEQG